MPAMIVGPECGISLRHRAHGQQPRPGSRLSCYHLVQMSEAIIIGAGPAGSLCGLLLRRRGWRVTLVEQSRFPRDKVCGECLSALGVEVLDRQGMLTPLLDRGAIWLDRAELYARDGTPLHVELAPPMLGVSRWTLDDLLLNTARQAGVVVMQPARCEAIES